MRLLTICILGNHHASRGGIFHHISGDHAENVNLQYIKLISVKSETLNSYKISNTSKLRHRIIILRALSKIGSQAEISDSSEDSPRNKTKKSFTYKQGKFRVHLLAIVACDWDSIG